MKLTSYSPLLALLSTLPLSHAWGALGHETVAYVAQNFVASETETFFQEVLNDTTTSYLANVATWADSFRYTKDGRYSAAFHFIDANDNPPQSCGVQYSRDCGKSGCVIGAINNYTSRVQDTSLSTSERDIATKFIVHFLGDIHQPLHDENLDLGGNTIPVNFTGAVFNLHAIWDTNMPEKLVGGYSLADAKRWAESLSTNITSGAYKSKASGWLEGIELSDPVNSSLIWAQEANSYVCTTVLPDGVEGVQGKELNGTYFQKAVPVIELQIARAGYRLATWLDLIASNVTESAIVNEEL